ncbi:GTP 3',8-cyclase [Candidatus Lokiarchaeum ossiferum]|uniref:GTP 3',8-cyclase n=1 Tax=Candidatus Lokiarchaeum ossiferum TaxID=2951803 RepID=A0ABY6HSY7_9ARCH|nr:GTP 3',8-cyclase [Candidatus Lokiarchaeum sp. B-35]
MDDENLNLKEQISKRFIVDENSHIPLFGLDFLGILDRGTNVLEVKPITVCNLKCKYCFVSAGDYNYNFIADHEYLLTWVKKAIGIKKCDDIEIHLAPYGEIFLYPHLEELVKGLKQIPEVKIVSIQSNGLLLTPDKIKMLETAGVDRLNLSLNSMDPEKCADYCGVKKYNLAHLLKMFDLVLASNMELLVAPVWFRGTNDDGIMAVIDYIKQKKVEGFDWPKLRLGIQNYLTYSSGRKIKKAKMREFAFFYKVLKKLEKEHQLKLKLGPKDFNIHRTDAVHPPVKLNETDTVEIIKKGRYDNEYIARLNETWAVKVLIKGELPIGEKLRVKFIKSSLRGNLLTAIPI